MIRGSRCLLVVLALLLPIARGCRKQAPARPGPSSVPAASQAANAPAPEPPADPEQEDLVSRPIIQDTTVADREKLSKYKQDPRAPSGSVIGACCVMYDKEVRLPTVLPVWPDGSNAIASPAAGEVNYFEKHPPIQPVPLSAWDRQRNRYGVGQTVLILRDVRAGPRPHLGRATLNIECTTGNIQIPQPGYNFGAFTVCFGPLLERLQLANTEMFNCQIEVVHAGTGQPLLRQLMDGYSDPKFPGQPFGTNFNMAQPKIVQSPPIRQPGRYEVRCLRHPWHRANLFVVDNPYVAVSGPDGAFRLDEVPVGKYAVEIWHEQFEPVQAVAAVEVVESKTAELLVQFKPPKLLTEPTWPTDKPVPQWVYIGPFPVGEEVKLPYGPEKGPIDFQATYAGRGNQKVGWKLAVADANGGVDLKSLLNMDLANTTWFFAAQVQAPRPGPILLGLAPTEYSLWVNGEPVKQRQRQHAEGIFAKDSNFVAAKLNAGLNTILLQVNSWREWPQTVAVGASFKGDDLQFTAPGGKSLQAGYLVNATLPVGTVKGNCFVACEKPAPIPHSVQLDLSGELAVKQPGEGELEYYTGPRRPVLPSPLGTFDDRAKRYGVVGAAVTLKEIKTGKRLPLKPSGFQVGWQQSQWESFAASGATNYGLGKVGFAPAGDPLQLLPTQPFAVPLAITRAEGGKVVWEGELPAYGDEHFPGQPYGASGVMARPQTVQTAPLVEPGHYLIASKRHPWMVGHVFVTEHPYVAASNARGDFDLSDVPPGKYAVRVWHEQLEPVKSEFAIEVAAGKPVDLPVEFKPPDALTRAAPLTDQSIREWAYAGPFERDLVQAPERAPIDFAAACDGKGGRKVRWQAVKADRNGMVDLGEFTGRPLGGGSSYLAAILDSPRPQKITLGVGSAESCQVWLNGKAIYDLLPGHAWTGRDYDFAIGALQAGQNVLLVKLSANERLNLSVSFKAEGVRPSVPDKAERPGYLFDDQAGTGGVRGLCYIPKVEQPVRVPSALPIELVGANAITDPQPGEAAWFDSFRRPGKGFGLGGYDGSAKRYAVYAAVMLRNVAAGARFPLRGTFLSSNCWTSQLETGANYNYGGGSIAFCRAGEGVAIRATELFSNHVVVADAAGGKPVFEADLPAYKDDRFPGQAYGQQGGMREPESVTTPPIDKPGHYVVTFARHPWKRADVFVTDNPYVGLTAWHNGEFRFDGLPPGKYALEAWQPGGFEPVAAGLEVEVQAGKTAEVAVEFKTPELLRNPPRLTDQDVRQWAVIGPFDRDLDKAYAPEQKLDFAARHEGKDKQSLRWQLVNADGSGLVNLFESLGRNAGASGYYLCANLQSPKDQTVLLGVGTSEYAKVWLNGELIFYCPTGRGLGKDSNFILGKLKAGTNTLLVKVATNGGGPGAGVSLKAEAVTVSLPAGPVRPAYLMDPAAGTGELRGTCFVPSDKDAKLPPIVPIHPTGGNAVRQPLAGEAEYYQAHCPVRPILLTAWNGQGKRYGVVAAAVVVKGVTAGRRYPLKPGGLSVNPRTGQAETAYGQNYGYGMAAFAPIGEPLALSTGELYPGRFALSDSAGKVIGEPDVPAYKDDRFPGVSFGETGNMAGPSPVSSPPIPAAGRYLLTDLRHPWRASQVIVTDNPYVAATDTAGNFRITDLPPGKYMVEVWHPDFQPIQPAHPVEVLADKPAELNVEFKPPAILQTPPPTADVPIRQWAFLGVFEKSFSEPERKLDLAGRYKARGGVEVGWRPASAGDDGRVDVSAAAGGQFKDVQASVSYFVAVLESPREQPVVLELKGDDSAWAFLNGAAIGGNYTAGLLKTGKNALLVRVSNEGGAASLSAKYHAEGVTASVPDLPK